MSTSCSMVSPCSSTSLLRSVSLVSASDLSSIDWSLASSPSFCCASAGPGSPAKVAWMPGIRKKAPMLSSVVEVSMMMPIWVEPWK